jgi:hypothetical protein
MLVSNADDPKAAPLTCTVQDLKTALAVAQPPPVNVPAPSVTSVSDAVYKAIKIATGK